VQDASSDELTAAEMADAFSGLLAAVAHDFRTPVAGIVGIGRILEDDFDFMSPEMLRECVRDMVRCGEELDRRITNVLDNISVGSGTFRVETEALQLRDELAETLDRTILLFENFTVEMEVPGDLAVVADRSALVRIVENLLSNAVKFSPKFSLIEVLAERSDDGVVITIADQGPGIPPEAAERIFGRFERLSEHRRVARGSGVGLAAVRQLAELMGGRAWVESRDGGGSAFKVLLPSA
jgi:two-component system sensor histidine kinase KdpD